MTDKKELNIIKVNPEKGGGIDEENPDGSFNRICDIRNVNAGVRPCLSLWVRGGSLRLQYTRSNSSKRRLRCQKIISPLNISAGGFLIFEWRCALDKVRTFFEKNPDFDF